MARDDSGHHKLQAHSMLWPASFAHHARPCRSDTYRYTFSLFLLTAARYIGLSLTLFAATAPLVGTIACQTGTNQHETRWEGAEGAT